MSADNKAAAAQEPAGGGGGSGAAAALMAAPSSEYLKRTCLICGCHTNQTINIYEKRSGPNIVQLIQAKFKFQPLNEDKYLCFSCNNWLINWHSLQAVNSNDADNQSPSHMSNNSSLAQEQTSVALRPRPIAQVRPRLVASVAPVVASPVATTLQHPSPPQPPSTFPPLQRSANQPPVSYGKRSMRGGRCREICKWRTLHLRSLAKLARLQRVLAQRRPRRMIKIAPGSNSNSSNQRTTTSSHQRYQPPRVDGKVVAMFRRLGTTLSREQQLDYLETSPPALPPPLPPIMSPAKQRPRWSRPIENDEIVLEFDSVISEVLPAPTSPTTSPLPSQAPSAGRARRRLRYQVTGGGAAATVNHNYSNNNNNFTEVSHQEAEVSAKVPSLNQALQDFRLPQGLSITLL